MLLGVVDCGAASARTRSPYVVRLAMPATGTLVTVRKPGRPPGAAA